MIYDYSRIVYAVIANIFFPEGFAIGSSGRKSNALEIERDGKGSPVIRGSSVAGLLRSKAEACGLFDDVCDFYFGAPLNRGEERRQSNLVFYDTVIQSGTEENMHNLINRHTGSVSLENKGLFSIERVAPGSKGELFFCLFSDSTMGRKDQELLGFLTKSLNGGILLGGNSNRGMGRCLLEEDQVYIRKFDLANAQDAAAYLDLIYAEKRELRQCDCVKCDQDQSSFKIEVSLMIPPGQDLLCSEGSDAYPVSVRKADGNEYWKIPGSSLRGIFKGWFSRLAAKDGCALSDNIDTYLVRQDQKIHESEILEDDCILDLFGSLEQKGRLHITDAYSSHTVSSWDVQKRSHVVIDRFTGGTNDGKLFENKVLLSSGKHTFKTMITIANATEKDTLYLQKTLQALHVGLLRIGSSKASGRLSVTSIKILSNPGNLHFGTTMKDF